MKQGEVAEAMVDVGNNTEAVTALREEVGSFAVCGQWHCLRAVGG